MSAEALDVASQILNLIQILLGIWHQLTTNDIIVQRVNTAMTNFVYIITANLRLSQIEDEDSSAISSEPERLLLRVYGKSNWMFKRETEELAAMTLANVGIIPKWYGIFGNGRFEDYAPSLPVSATSYRDIRLAKKVGIQLSKIHCLLPKLKSVTGWLEEDYLWERLESWSMAASKAFKVLTKAINDESHFYYLNSIESWGIFKPETIPTLKDSALKVNSPLVFGHCDVL